MTLKGAEKRINEAIAFTITQYANLIYSEAMSLAPQSVKNSLRIKIGSDRMSFSIYSEDVLAAYHEFGTGKYASLYLMGKPQEMIDNAMQFFVDGSGRLAASPYLYPTYYKYRDEILKTIDERVQKILDKVKIR